MFSRTTSNHPPAGLRYRHRDIGPGIERSTAGPAALAQCNRAASCVAIDLDDGHFVHLLLELYQQGPQPRRDRNPMNLALV